MANKLVKVEEFENEVKEMLGDYYGDVFKKAENHIEDFVQRIVEELKRTSNRSESDLSGKYAEGWTYAKEEYMGEYSFIIYNKNKPTLTHLLEFGWLTEYVEVFGNAHISKAFEKYEEDIINELYAQLNK